MIVTRGYWKSYRRFEAFDVSIHPSNLSRRQQGFEVFSNLWIFLSSSSKKHPSSTFSRCSITLYKNLLTWIYCWSSTTFLGWLAQKPFFFFQNLLTPSGLFYFEMRCANSNTLALEKVYLVVSLVHPKFAYSFSLSRFIFSTPNHEISAGFSLFFECLPKKVLVSHILESVREYSQGSEIVSKIGTNSRKLAKNFIFTYLFLILFYLIRVL